MQMAALIAAGSLLAASEDNNAPEAGDGIRITCDGETVFDSGDRVVTYRKAVEIHHPGFSLEGADELRLTFGGTGADGGRGRIRGFGASDDGGIRMDATGAIRIEGRSQEAADGAFSAGCRTFTYEEFRKRIVLEGGPPWIRQGPVTFRGLGESARFEIDATGALSAEGVIEATIEFPPTEQYERPPQP